MDKGKLFIISGPSGAGKGTICKEILDQESNIKLSISMTTRDPRVGEIDKVHYYFVDCETFEALVRDDGFMEYANVYGNFYGTPKAQVFQWLEQGMDVILEIDVQGALQVKKNYPQGILIFILPPSLAELKERIRGRGSETEEVMSRRLSAVMEEISYIDRYDYGVVNEDLQYAIDCVRGIILAEQCKLDDGKVDCIVKKYAEINKYE